MNFERFWAKDDPRFDKPGEGAPPVVGCTPENEGAGGKASQRGGSPASPLLSSCGCRKGARCIDHILQDGLTKKGLVPCV